MFIKTKCYNLLSQIYFRALWLVQLEELPPDATDGRLDKGH